MTLTAPVVPGTTDSKENEKPSVFWLVLWCLLVLGVQPWSSRTASPQGTTGSTNSLMKGALLGAIFLIVLAATRPGFRTRISPSTNLYVVYVLFATATGFLLADPGGPLLRLARFMIGLVLMFLLWRPLIAVPERLIRAHLWAHAVLAATVVLSVAYAPGQAWRPLSSFGTGFRLQGVIIPMLPPRVGEVGAILLGLAIIALISRKLSFVPAGALIGVGLVLVALSRTRTAAAAVAFGLILALLLTRKTWAGRILTLGVPGLVGLVFLAVPSLHTWLLRGQGTEQISSLSGRTTSWQYVLDEQVSLQTAIIGHGLGNKRVLLRRGEGDIDVMAIDNSWLGLYWETGLLAVVIVGIAMIVAWVSVLRAPTPYVKACGALLLGYVSVASLNESGLSDLSSMTLHLLVAAAVCDSDRLRQRSRAAARQKPYEPLPLLLPNQPQAKPAKPPLR
ncbi:O-antigen ligase family protein [Kribbella sp. DT2]|uniref:O-antigen ligase family protein n=1 Tax=Kribbella sp. DT2 TaxID=3393427 RepID=UPI003CFA8149